MKTTLKLFFLALGFISLGLGTVGILVPILPTVPFYMLTAFCFAKSSDRLHNWFVHTKLYKKHLESFVEKREMTRKTKLTIMTTVTALMLFGFIMMNEVLIGRVVLAIVWLFHVCYFVFRIKTVPEVETA